MICAQLFEQVDGSDDAAPGASHARFRSAGLGAVGVAEAARPDVLQIDVVAFLPQRVENRFLRQPSQQKARRIRLRIAADHHYFLAHFGQGRNRVLRCGGFADSAFTVDGNFSHSGSVSCRWTWEQIGRGALGGQVIGGRERDLGQCLMQHV